ncbi:tryptophan-rich sensory protein [Paenibacillus solani]|uniref:tryptophan-rich sensory protein n=1 Tax=Paenibacillus solani TaxID=1705565 RepID=UPI003D27EF1F
MYRTNTYRWWNLLFFAGVITVNVLSMVLPLGGRTTGEISDMYYTPITPAGYAFSIWSLIYIMLLLFVIYQLRRDTGNRDSVRAIGPWFILSCVFNMTWLVLWHYLYIEWSVIAMLLLLVTLWILHARTQAISYPTTGEKWLLKLPFSLYIGWVSPAFIVNVAIVLQKNGWNPFGMDETTTGIVLLCIGALLALLISLRYRDSIVPLVFTWAYVAIAAEHRETDSILMSAFVISVILLVYAIWLFFTRNRRSSRY